MPDVAHDFGLVEDAEQLLVAVPVLTHRRTVCRELQWITNVGWHQDGPSFGCDAPSPCVWATVDEGDGERPALDLLPKRFDAHLDATGVDQRIIPLTRSGHAVRRAGDGIDPVRPRFGVGDALFVDDKLVPVSAMFDGTTESRRGLERWFFPQGRSPTDQGEVEVASR
ncbi:MAG: hypothetical protein OEW42_01145 [Acidimicrobiia bacterium]|nr:hypothetical protein [Acidimicrobiia bacterium]